MAIEIVDLPIEHGGSFHSYVNVYQRVMTKWWYNDSYNNDDIMIIFDGYASEVLW